MGLLAPRQHCGTTPYYRVNPQPFEAQGAPLEPNAIQVMGSGLGWLNELRALASGSKLDIYTGAEMTGKSTLLNLGLASVVLS